MGLADEYYIEVKWDDYPHDPDEPDPYYRPEDDTIMCWLCPGCDHVIDWEFGCAHDNPEESTLCDDCWVERYGSGRDQRRDDEARD